MASRWDRALYLGTIGFFFVCMMLFIRWIPMISVCEIREIVHKQAHKEQGS